LVTGRDPIGQLVDNAVVDANNRIINTSNATITGIYELLRQNTRIAPGYTPQQCPTGNFLFQTNPGETKINALQRYLQMANCLIWTDELGLVVLGKPDFSQDVSGKLILNATDPSNNNVLEGRCRRNTNNAIRLIVTQLSTLGQVDAGSYTLYNNDKDVSAVASAGVGRSVYNTFSYGDGNDVVNQITAVGNSNASPNKLGNAYSQREIARENVKVIEVEMVVQGHLNENDEPYNIDQIYSVTMEDDDLNEDMYVYACDYELTVEHGMMTRLRLCRLGTLVASGDVIPRSN
jgi:prophage tail gpP-like protein